MDIVLKSFVAWGAAALVLTVAKYAGPRMAGAVGGVPIIFAVSYILVTYHNKPAAKNFLIGGAYGTIGFIVFLGALLLLNQRYAANHWINFAFAYALCLLVAIITTHLSTPRT